jgi:outer membrane protein with beta-barrel domain
MRNAECGLRIADRPVIIPPVLKLGVPLAMVIMTAMPRLRGAEDYSFAWLTYNYSFDFEVGDLEKKVQSGSSLGGGINFLRLDHFWLGVDAMFYRLTSPVADFNFNDYSFSYRGGAGLRATFPVHEDLLRPYLRAGGLYRANGTGDRLDLDFHGDGGGWSVGGGIEIRVLERLTVGPAAAFEEVYMDHGVIGRTTVVGVNLTVIF